MYNKKIIIGLISAIFIVGATSSVFYFKNDESSSLLLNENKKLNEDKKEKLEKYSKVNSLEIDKQKLRSDYINLAMMSLKSLSYLESKLYAESWLSTVQSAVLITELNEQRKFLMSSVDNFDLKKRTKEDIESDGKRLILISEFTKNVLQKLNNANNYKFDTTRSESSKNGFKNVFFFASITESLENLKEKTGSQKLKYCENSLDQRKEFLNKNKDLSLAYDQYIRKLGASNYFKGERLESLLTDKLNKIEVIKSNNDSVGLIFKENNSNYTLAYDCDMYIRADKDVNDKIKSLQNTEKFLEYAPNKAKSLLKDYCDKTTQENCLEATNLTNADILLTDINQNSDQEVYFDNIVRNSVIRSVTKVGFFKSSDKPIKDFTYNKIDKCPNLKEGKRDLVEGFKKYETNISEITSKIEKQNLNSKNTLNQFRNISRDSDKVSKVISVIKQNKDANIECNELISATNSLNKLLTKSDYVLYFINNYDKLFNESSPQYCKMFSTDDCQKLTKDAAILAIDKMIFFFNADSYMFNDYTVFLNEAAVSNFRQKIEKDINKSNIFPVNTFTPNISMAPNLDNKECKSYQDNKLTFVKEMNEFNKNISLYTDNLKKYSWITEQELNKINEFNNTLKSSLTSKKYTQILNDINANKPLSVNCSQFNMDFRMASYLKARSEKMLKIMSTAESDVKVLATNYCSVSPPDKCKFVIYKTTSNYLGWQLFKIIADIEGTPMSEPDLNKILAGWISKSK